MASTLVVDKIMCALSLLIFLSNMAEITLLLRIKRSWHNAQIMLFSLALTDATLGYVTSITKSILLSQKYDNFSIFFVVERVIHYLNICSSSLIVLLIAMDRWIAVKWLMRYRILMTRKRLYIGILLSAIIEKINDTYQVDVNLRFYETSSQEDERL